MKPSIKLVNLKSQHSCFEALVAGGDLVVTVYSKHKKTLKCGEINWALDQAKDVVLGRVSK